VATSSSSTKKAARLAQKGKGQKVRFQGGTLFPLVVALVVVLGTALVIYARQSRPAADASAPTIDDHWHHTYGFLICDTWVQLEGDGEALDANGRPTNLEYARTGIHSHDDGLIHWHPFSSASVGSRAQLGVFLDVYGVELSDDVLQFPEDQRAQLPAEFQEDGRFESGETECTIDGETETGRLQVVRWDNISDTGDGTTFIAGFNDIRLDKDAMAVVIAFVPDGTDVGKPPWIDSFEEDALNDSGQPGTDELFPGVEVDSDGDVTVGTDEIGEEDVGPAVETPVSSDGPTSTDPVTTEVPADETDS
jgi:hypothetical protein